MKIECIDEYKIHSYDSDMKGRLSLPVLTRFLQDSAWQHSNDMQIGYHKLKQNNMTWVLYKQYIEMNKWAAWGDTISIRTYPSQSDKLFCYREFEISLNDEIIGKVSTSWLVIDLASRRPVRTSKYYSGNYNIDMPILFPVKIKAKLKTIEPETSVIKQQVQISDIDVNNHVNNSCYPMWCLNSYPMDFYRDHKLHTIEQQFAAEALFGDELTIVTSHRDNLVFEHNVRRDGKDLFLLKLEWEESGRY
jgi:acyl-ACP thioesterase